MIHAQTDPAELAFEGLRAEVIVMRRALEGLVDQLDGSDVARRTELIGTHVVGIVERLDQIIEANAITDPVTMRRDMAQAREVLLRPAQDALRDAMRGLADAGNRLQAAEELIRRERAQRQLLWRVAGASVLAGVIAFPLVVLPLARTLPDSWSIPDVVVPSPDVPGQGNDTSRGAGSLRP